MNQKGNAVLIIAIIVLGIILVGLFLYGFSQRECNKNNDCMDDSYCGSDFACHKYPEEIIVKDRDYLGPALILGIALITAAYIYRGGRIPRIKIPLAEKKETIMTEEVKEKESNNP